MDLLVKFVCLLVLTVRTPQPLAYLARPTLIFTIQPVNLPALEISIKTMVNAHNAGVNVLTAQMALHAPSVQVHYF